MSLLVLNGLLLNLHMWNWWGNTFLPEPEWSASLHPVFRQSTCHWHSIRSGPVGNTLQILHLLISCLLSDFFNVCDLNNSVNSSDVDTVGTVYVEALSEIICWGTDFRASNRLHARRKVCIDKSVKTLRWTALVEVHVKRQSKPSFEPRLQEHTVLLWSQLLWL